MMMELVLPGAFKALYPKDLYPWPDLWVQFDSGVSQTLCGFWSLDTGLDI